MAPTYVTGHRNPDTDSIASAIGYAELKGRLDVQGEYLPVRLGECNPQTRWLLERSGAAEPELLEHVQLRACDVMTTRFTVTGQDEPVRRAGLAMALDELELVPVADEHGALAGVITERTLARRFIRETRHTSTLKDAPTHISAIVDVLGGELVAGEDQVLAGRVWVHAMDPAKTPSGVSRGDVVVTGNRDDAQRLCIELGAALIVLSNGSSPSEEILTLAAERGATIVVSPLDTYVSGRMITLAAPCRALMEDPPTVTAEDLVHDISEQVKESHHGGAVVVDALHRPIGLVTRSDLVTPARRRVILVDHAEQGQSVPGVEEAEIVEILDHHHIGSIETRFPITATFDPVGSTATLVVERFRQNGMEPSSPAAAMLLGAVLSDTVILNSPTTTERDHTVVEYLQGVLALDGLAFGGEMFEATSDVSDVSADEIVSRDAKLYQVRGGQICIAQIEVVGGALLERKDELLDAMRRARERRDLHIYVLMVTDVLSKGTELLVAGDTASVARAFGAQAQDGLVELPGVMSRKKEVAPKLMAVL